MQPASAELQTGLAESNEVLSTLELVNGIETVTLSQNGESTSTTPSETDVPAHRSHDPLYNAKRTDPFQFGSRYLQDGDDPFEFNAWDHVTPDETYYTYAEAQYALQRAAPVTPFDAKRFNAKPEKWWNDFYANNTANFFKDRKWLFQEFKVLEELTHDQSHMKDDSATQPPRENEILEVGAGAGNTAFPILQMNRNPYLRLWACDYSAKAISLIRANSAYKEPQIRAEVWDVANTNGDMPAGLTPGTADVVLMVFVFSALHPDQWAAAVRNVYTALRPGGQVCLRDYARGDLTQVRAKKGRLLQESFYIRGDGTRVYYFEEEELRRIWGGGEASEGDERPRFDVLDLGLDRRMLVNRQKQLKMYRCWLQGRFRKPLDNTIEAQGET